MHLPLVASLAPLLLGADFSLPPDLPPFDLYFFDGPHSTESHYNSILLYNHLASPVYILVVDDWNFPSVKEGTVKGIGEAERGAKRRASKTISCDENRAHS